MKLFSNKHVEASTEAVQQDFVMETPFWNILSDLHISQKNLDAAGTKLAAHIHLGYLQEEDFAELKSIKDTIKAYGCSEGLMACVNENDQLARCLSIAIPEVSPINAQSVGIACCEAIESKIDCSCGLTCNFLKDLAGNVDSFLKAFNSNLECQKETIKVVNDGIIKSVQYVEAEKFAKAEIFGYAKPVFFDRVKAIEEIVAGINECDSEACAEKFAPALKVLGYVVEQTVEVRPETNDEAVATEPEVSEVMSAPVQTAEKSEEELEGPAEEPKAEPVKAFATDACQPAPIAVMRWTPSGIAEAAVAVVGLIGKAEGIVALGGKIKTLVEATVAECDKEGEKDEQVRAKIDADRRFISFLSSVLHLLGKCTNELVDQVVCMGSTLKKFEAEKEEETVVKASEITEEKPLADKCSKAGYRFAKKLINEAVPPMEVKPKEEGTQPAVAPAPEQKEVEQPKPAQAEPDPAMTVTPKEEGLPGKPADLPEPQGEKIQPKVEEPGTKAEGGLVEDPIVSTPATPEAQPVLPAPTPEAEPVVPTEPAPAEPVAPPAPEAPVAPAEQPAPAQTVEDPVVAPIGAPAVSDNVNGNEDPKAVPAPAEPVEPPKGTEPVTLDPALNKPVTDPVPEEKVVPAGEEKPAEQVKELQEPEKTNQNVAEAKAKGKIWF